MGHNAIWSTVVLHYRISETSNAGLQAANLGGIL